MTPEQILAFEATNPQPSPDRDERIRRELGITPIRYYSLLRRAENSRAGIAAQPITARRVRERASRRAAVRDARVGSGIRT